MYENCFYFVFFVYFNFFIFIFIFGGKYWNICREIYCYYNFLLLLLLLLTVAIAVLLLVVVYKMRKLTLEKEKEEKKKKECYQPGTIHSYNVYEKMFQKEKLHTNAVSPCTYVLIPKGNDVQENEFAREIKWESSRNTRKKKLQWKSFS